MIDLEGSAAEAGLGFGGLLVGAGADAAYIDAARTQTILGTVRGRVGVAFNTVLVYGTGALACGEAFNKASLYTAGLPSEFHHDGRKSTGSSPGSAAATRSASTTRATSPASA